MLFILASLLAFQISPESYACSHGCDFKGTSYLGVHWNYFFCQNLSPFLYFNFLFSTIMISKKKRNAAFYYCAVFFILPNSFYADFYGKEGSRKSFASADIEVCYNTFDFSRLLGVIVKLVDVCFDTR